VKSINFDNLESPYFIAEIGINHNGDMQIAKKLIDAVFCCNWHCAKFQKRNPDVAVPEKQKNVMRDTPWGRMTYLEYRYRVEFSKEQYDYIDNYCKEKPLDWTASIWDVDSLKFLADYDIPFIKLPSAKVTNIEILKEAAGLQIPLIISTGMSTIAEIDESVNIIMKNGKKPIIMHTNSSYPAPHDELNLRMIPFYKSRYDCVIGYSGHEEDLEPTVVAVALGAQVIERHVTLSHNMWGTDQKASLEVHAMNMLKNRTKDIKIMLGDGVKTITKSELQIRDKLRGN
jgi:N-acetylneuraminate synthase